ncbi:hypothetical protein ANN_10167 [Periplaneta americana]|uniref:Uncharacterized protein n=1 Tax=Periplaneta americana TaxID=6978 RepID=A0ABQ8TNN5_PERAM|nr:hypothetical protein ANN_10167 [Periplaneta americana]
MEPEACHMAILRGFHANSIPASSLVRRPCDASPFLLQPQNYTLYLNVMEPTWLLQHSDRLQTGIAGFKLSEYKIFLSLPYVIVEGGRDDDKQIRLRIMLADILRQWSSALAEMGRVHRGVDERQSIQGRVNTRNELIALIINSAVLINERLDCLRRATLSVVNTVEKSTELYGYHISDLIFTPQRNFVQGHPILKCCMSDRLAAGINGTVGGGRLVLGVAKRLLCSKDTKREPEHKDDTGCSARNISQLIINNREGGNLSAQVQENTVCEMWNHLPSKLLHSYFRHVSGLRACIVVLQQHLMQSSRSFFFNWGRKASELLAINVGNYGYIPGKEFITLEMGRACRRMGESRNAYRLSVGRPEGKIPLRRPRRRWEDNIKLDLKEVVYNVRDWINLAQDRDRHCHNEVETLAHVLGSCPHGEALRNSRHHQVRSIIATALKHADYNTFEEVHGLSVTGSTRLIDIIAFKESTRSGYIIDPTVRFETDEEQPAEVDNGKKNIYNPTIPYYLKKYQLK